MTFDLAALPSGDWMARTFSYAAQTLANGDPGTATVITKLSELLFVEAVRSHIAALPREETGLAGRPARSRYRTRTFAHACADQRRLDGGRSWRGK